MSFWRKLFGRKRRAAAPKANPARPAHYPGDERIVLARRRGFGLRVTGATHYQDVIRRFFGRGVLDATLAQEPQNPHDPNAIKVTIEGIPVGHLSREDAAYFTEWIGRRGYQGRRFKAPALVEDVTFDDGQMRLLMVGLGIMFSPPSVEGDLSTAQKHGVNLVHRQGRPLCVQHMERAPREPGAVSLNHLVDDGLVGRVPCEVCGKPGYDLSEKGFVAKFGQGRAFVEANPGQPTVSGWDA